MKRAISSIVVCLLAAACSTPAAPVTGSPGSSASATTDTAALHSSAPTVVAASSLPTAPATLQPSPGRTATPGVFVDASGWNAVMLLVGEIRVPKGWTVVSREAAADKAKVAALRRLMPEARWPILDVAVKFLSSSTMTAATLIPRTGLATVNIDWQPGALNEFSDADAYVAHQVAEFAKIGQTGTLEKLVAPSGRLLYRLTLPMGDDVWFFAGADEWCVWRLVSDERDLPTLTTIAAQIEP